MSHDPTCELARDHATCGCAVRAYLATPEHQIQAYGDTTAATERAPGDFECCASGRCEVCTPGYVWGRDG